MKKNIVAMFLTFVLTMTMFSILVPCFAANEPVDSDVAVDIVHDQNAEKNQTEKKTSFFADNSPMSALYKATNIYDDAETTSGSLKVYKNNSNKSDPYDNLFPDRDELTPFPENITVEELGDRLESKGLKVARLVLRVGRVITGIAFFIALVFISVNAIFGGRDAANLVGKGIIACLVAGAMYICLTFAPEFLRTFLGWVAL